MILKHKVEGLSAWVGSAISADSSWKLELDKTCLAEIAKALLAIKQSGNEFPRFNKSDFPIGNSLRSLLNSMTRELEQGKGFCLVQGLPLDSYNETDIENLYYGLGLHLGTPVCQNPKGDLLGRVMNVGDLENKETRVYETNAYLPYHTDLSDVFGLICVRKAKTGGLTSLVSSGAVYNEILQRYPEYLGLFYRPMFYAHLGEGTPKAPIFSYHEGKLSCRYLRQYIELGHELHDSPLSRVEVEALDVFDSIIHDENIRLDMMLEPGEMLFANNYSVMHSRTSFEDFAEPEKRRKLLRLWVKMPGARTLAADFPGKNGFPPP